MSRMFVVLSAAAFIVASSQIVFADESGTLLEQSEAPSPGLLSAARSALSWAASGAQQSATP